MHILAQGIVTQKHLGGGARLLSQAVTLPDIDQAFDQLDELLVEAQTLGGDPALAFRRTRLQTREEGASIKLRRSFPCRVILGAAQVLEVGDIHIGGSFDES